MDDANKRAIIGIGAAIGIGCLATAIVYVASETQNYVARVDGVRITQEAYDKGVEAMRAGPMGNMQSEDMVKQGVVRQLVERQLIENEASKRHITPADKDVTAKIDEIKKPYGDDEHFAKVLEANHLTLADLKDRVRYGTTVEALGKDLAKSDQPTDNQVKQYYDQHLQAFQTQPEVRASHILVKDEAKAKELLAKLKAGANFAELARANSLDGSKAKGGDLGFFGRGRMVPEFENAAFGLKKGQLSGIVKTQFGYHIILVTDTHPGVAKTFDQVKADARTQLSKQHEHDALDKWLADARKATKIDYKEGFAPPTPRPTPSSTPGATPIPTAPASGPATLDNSTKGHAPTPAASAK